MFGGTLFTSAKRPGGQILGGGGGGGDIVHYDTRPNLATKSGPGSDQLWERKVVPLLH